MAHDRRSFLATLGAVALGAARPSALAALTNASLGSTKLSKIGIQLYTVRRAAAADLAGTLARIGKIGFREVELAGYYNHSAAEFRDLLKQNGLVAPAGHIAIDLIEKDPAKTFADAHAVGHEWITVPSLPRGKHETEDDWKQVAAQFNSAAKKAKAEGFRFAFHNHNDIVRTQNGILPVEILMRETDPALVFYQMDLYWVVSGGADPLALVAKYPNRFKMFHVKDGRPPYTDASQTDLGQGTIDFKPIFATTKGIEHYFMESDSAADPMMFAESGYKYLANLEY
ncbi:MAG TPA: sugar phosphate isomerase/epimerase [Gemmatimonadaceae bacterium]|jgi:sugar phosphate isomerase/epimerase